MGAIENTHGTDDEYSLLIRAEERKRKEELSDKAHRWQGTCNKVRADNR